MISILDSQIEELRMYWPQSHYETSATGSHLIVVPSVLLREYNKTICTVLFVAPPGFPSSCPDHFYTDVTGIRLLKPRKDIYHLHDGDEIEYSDIPQNINTVDVYIPGFPQWRDLTWWSWHLQGWDPNRDKLITYMHVIKNRLFPAR